MKTKIKFLAMMLMGIMLSTNVWGDVTDEISRSDISGWATSYSVHSISGTNSDAVYKIYSMKSTNNSGYTGGDIQLRKEVTGKNAKQGAYIVTTTSGGNIKTISITWADVSGGSQMNNTSVDIYGSNTAFTPGTTYTDDYYATIPTQGIKLGTISAASNAPVNVTGDYAYVGIVPTGACYISSISFTYSTGPDCTTDLDAPVVTATAGNGSATLTWGVVEHATKYQVSWNNDAYTDAISPYIKSSLTNGQSYTWKVKAIGGGICCDSEVSGSVTPSANHTVTWYVDGEVYTAGNPTTGVAHGDKVATLPYQPAVPDACDGLVFVGWTDQEVTDGKEPSPLFKDAASAPLVTANVSYHAVFAEEDE